jgi:CBS domain-containing protein
MLAYGGNMLGIGEVMDPAVVAVGVGDRLLTVEDIMTLGGVRHMPVVKAGRLVGVVSERDLLWASPSNLMDRESSDRRAFLSSVEVSRVMSSPAIVIDAKASLRDAARMMLDHRIGCLPVVDDKGQLLGMLSAVSLLEAFAEDF